MATKKAVSGKTDVTGESASDEVTAALKTIFATDSIPDSVRRRREKQQKVNLIVAFIGDQFTNILGTTETRPPLGEATDRAIFRTVQSTATSLRHFDLTIEDAMTVVDKICKQIKMEGVMIDDADPSVLESTDDPKLKYSDQVSRVLNDLGFQCVQYIIEKTKKDITQRSLPDKVIEVQRRKKTGWMYKPYYDQAQNVLLMDLAEEIAAQQRRKKIHDAIYVSAPEVPNDTIEGNNEYELNSREKMLAKICPLFRDATPKIQQDVWSKLRYFTLNQWALFIIEVDSTRKNYASTADAVKGIIKPKAKTLEEISGRTNMRGVSIIEESKQYHEAMEKVREITSILRADAILRKNQLVTPNRTLTEI